MKLITVLIPCYNEEAAIASVIAALPVSELRRHAFKFDILVVDNNSRDRTAEVARAAGARVIAEAQQGKGYAIRRGFANLLPETEFVVMLDGDDTYKAAEIMRLIEPIACNFAPVIIGSRMYGAIRDGSMKPLNRLGNRVYSRLVRMSYGVAVTDVLTGYFAWRRDVVVALLPHLRSAGFAIEMEMITKMARMGFAIYSVPVSYDARLGQSSLNPVLDGAKILKMFVQNLVWTPGQLSRDVPTQVAVASSIPISPLAEPAAAAFYESLPGTRKP